MSTTDNKALFERLMYYSYSQEGPFAVAARKAEQMKVVEFNRLRYWYELFPIPKFESTLRPSLVKLHTTGKHPGETVREQQQQWEIDASLFFTQRREKVASQLGRATYLFKEILEAWESRSRPIGEEPDTIAMAWMRKMDLPLADFCKLFITEKMLQPFFVEFAEKWEDSHGVTETFSSTGLAARKPKRLPARPFANFTDKLLEGFTEEDLNKLLIHMKFKNEEGKTLKFKLYLMHPVIDALIQEGYYEQGNREKDQKALSRFLGLPETRIKNGYGKVHNSTIYQRAITHLRKEQEKNGSN